MSIKINCDHKANNYCFRIYYKLEQSQNRKQRWYEVLPQLDANLVGIRSTQLSLVKIDSVQLQKEAQLGCIVPFRVRLKMRTDCCREKPHSVTKCIIKNNAFYDFITDQEISTNATLNCCSYPEVVRCVQLKISSSVASFSASTFKIYNHRKLIPRIGSSIEKTLADSSFSLRITELLSEVKNTANLDAISLIAAFRPDQLAENYFNIDSTLVSRTTNYSDHSNNLSLRNVHDKEIAPLNSQYIKRKIVGSNFNSNRNYKNNLPFVDTWQTARILLQHQQHQFINLFLIMLLFLSRTTSCHGLLVVDPKFVGLPADGLSNGNSDSSNILNSNYNNTRIGIKSGASSVLSSTNNGGPIGGSLSSSSAVGSSGGGHYLDKLDNLERSVAAVLIKVAYGTTSTTKRSIPDNSYVPSLTTIATPPLTTLRYLEKAPHQQQLNVHHRNYELDLERDHALPTSAPNADILKSNSNPTYPNPNRHHNHERDRHRHGLVNSSPSPSMSNTLKKNNGQLPTIPLYPGDMPSYSPPARSFFTPPLPPEYQNPFADKPTLRGTNNEGVIANTGSYINRRPIPPPSLMPGHERIPFRPPDLAGSSSGSVVSLGSGVVVTYTPSTGVSSISPSHTVGNDAERKKALNTPSRGIGGQPTGHSNGGFYNGTSHQFSQETTTQFGNNGSGPSSENQPTISTQHHTRKEVLPSIRRILSGSNGNKGEIPEVILKQVTSRPVVNYHQPPSSPVVFIDSTSQDNKSEDVAGGLVSSSNINKSKNGGDVNESEEDPKSAVSDSGNEKKMHSKAKMSSKSTEYPNDGSHQMNNAINSTPSTATALGEVAASAATSTSSTTVVTSATSSSSSSSSSIASAAAAHATWAVAWNIHVYLSVILFTILGVYSFYKMLTYNKLTHLFAQSYFVCIHLILIVICTARIFYLCYDAYNIHSTLHIFVSEILLNLPATFLTISFSVLILFLFLKSLNHKNNRYSALIRPLTVIVGCGVHVVLCITLHYVESYTMQNHQQHLYYQQQFYRQRQQAQQYASSAASSATTSNVQTPIGSAASYTHHTYTTTVPTPPPRVLSLICQIIYIFICLSLGLLYLYIYRILKRILRSKSQNYIHGFQNLSYAIHITIATALLFVLLAALQIFGAISISITRPLIMQVTSEMDWLQWGYQFSLRLIEIAIITLMSWVAGLKTNGGSLNVVVGGDPRGIGGGAGSGGSSGVFGSTSGTGGNREKQNSHHHHHSNVAGFFLPCTSSSSQEQFETDYPAVCNANTNLHTYTMRTGKLIYDDSFALNSLGGSGGGQTLSACGGRNAEFQLQQPTYQRPYDSGSLHCSVTNHNNVEFSAQGTPSNNHYHHHGHHQYVDYLTDATTDHYENPNFELRGNGSTTANAMQKLTAQTSTTSTSASCSGGSGTSAASQQQMLLLQSDSCYSEPMAQNYNTSLNYELNNFERSNFGGNGSGGDVGPHQPLRENWSDHQAQTSSSSSRIRDKTPCTHLERAAYENPERRSSNSTHSCSSGGPRYASYNCYELGNTSNVRKSGTLNNIASGGIINGRNAASLSSGGIIAASQRASGVHTLAIADRYHHQQQQQAQLPHQHQKGGRSVMRGMGVVSSRERERERGHDVDSERDFSIERSSIERTNNQSILCQQNVLHNSDDDMMLPGSNAECTNLISNGDDSCIPNKDSNLLADGNTMDQNISSSNSTNSAIGVNGNEQRLQSKTPHFISSTHSHTHAHSNNTFSKPIVSRHNRHHATAAVNTTSSFNHNSFHSSGCLDSVASASSSTNSAESSTTSAESATSGSMLVAEHGFVRFRALEDINNAQGVGIHNASIRNQNRTVAVVEQSQQVVAQNS